MMRPRVLRIAAVVLLLLMSAAPAAGAGIITSQVWNWEDDGPVLDPLAQKWLADIDHNPFGVPMSSMGQAVLHHFQGK